MIYILFSNGASVIPQFIPGIPQLLLVLVALWVLVSQRFRPYWPILAVMLGFLLLLSAAILNGLPDEGARFAKLLLNALVASLIAAGLNKRYAGDFPKAYSQAILVFTCIGIIGLIIASMSAWSLTSAIGDREYHTNLLTTWLTDGGSYSSRALFSPLPYRLQSLFDEPGTFGMLLVPAFYFYVNRGQKTGAIFLLLGTFLSESANAWAMCSLILAVKAFTLKSSWAKLLFTLALTGALAGAWPTLTQLYEIKTGIDEAYSNSSSLGTRSIEFEYVRQAWELHLVPLQNRQVLSMFPDGISVSYVSWYVTAGAVFVLMIAPVLISVVANARHGGHQGIQDRFFPLVLVTILLLSGFQRSSFLDNVLFMSLTFWCLIYQRCPTEGYP